MRIQELFNNAKEQSLSEDSKKRLKFRVLREIQQTKSFSEYAFFNAKQFKLNSLQKSIIRENLLLKIENKSSFLKTFSFANFLRRGIAGAMAFMLAFLGFSEFVSDENFVLASEFTKIESLTGDAFVFRGDYKIPAYVGMELKRRDRVLTSSDSELSIAFMDDSVSRLRSSTDFKINEISVFDQSKLKTYVEVEVVSGIVWNKVVNLVDENSSFVVKADDIYAKAKKAAFNIEVEENKAEMSVFKNNIEIHSPSSSQKIASVMTGQKMVIDKETKVLEVRKIEKEKKTDTWIVSNLKEDETYIEKIQVANIEEKQVVLAEKNEKLAFSDVENEKTKFEIAEKDFLDAQLKLLDDSLTDEERSLYIEKINSFSESYESYKNFIDKVSERDEKYAYSLTQSLDDSLTEFKKSLDLVLPDSPIYLAKEELKEIGYLGLNEELPIAMQKITDVKDSLVEAEALAEKGNIEAAKDIVVVGTEIVEETKQLIENTPVVENTLESDSLAMQIIETEVMVNNMQEIVIPEASEVFSLMKDGDYGSSILGDKPIDPLLDVRE